LRTGEAGFGSSKDNRQHAMDALHGMDDAATVYLGKARKVAAMLSNNGATPVA